MELLGRVGTWLVDLVAGLPSRRWWWAVLAGPACALLWLAAYGQVDAFGIRSQDSASIGLVTGLATMPLLLRRRSPVLALAVVAGAVAILCGTAPVLPVGAVVALLVAVYTVGARSSRLLALAGGVVAGLSVLPLLGNQLRQGVPVPLPLTVSLILGALALGDQVSIRRRTEVALAAEADQRRREQARRAVLEERSRIARELHDVVAHHMSMVAVQAETAPYRIPDLPEAGKRDFAAIGATAREALTEMRRLLGVLRSEREVAELTPQPGLADLGELVEVAKGAGLPVHLRVDTGGAQLPAGVELSAYRIVQEALSNAGQHAQAVGSVEVSVVAEAGRLLVSVTDDGRAGAGATVATGHGLLGMSERVAMLGGTLRAGPLPGGGFQVAAELPIDPGKEGV